jgi:hypothetical protein
MRFPLIRAGIVVSAAAIALAACAGHGLVPSQSAAPNLVVTPMATPNQCYEAPFQPAWIFKGSCVFKKLAPKGTSISLGAYKSITAVTVAFPKNTSKGGPVFLLADALGGKAKDIKPYKGVPFPGIPKTSGKSVVYIQAVNSFTGLKFTSGNLVVTVKAKSLSSNKCSVALLRKSGAKLSWFTIPIAPSVSGNVITEKIPAGAIGTLYAQGLPAGPLYFNAACK